MGSVAAVCTGSGLIARASLLDGHKATTNKAAWGAITPLGPKTYWVGHARYAHHLALPPHSLCILQLLTRRLKRWVETNGGKIWTSSGVSAGTDCFLAFIEYVYGKDDHGVSWAYAMEKSMEWTRAKDANDDPWAKEYNVHDVPPE